MDLPVVVIAEKNSVAVQISKIFPHFNVTSVAGHIKKLSFKKYIQAPWLKTNLKDLLTDQMVYLYRETANKSIQNINRVKKLGAIHLILAMDPDQEGDLIAQHVLKEFNTKNLGKVSKVKLESLSPTGIREAFTNIEPLSGTQGYSADLRTRLDLLFGSILSRFVSLQSFKCSNRWITFNSGRVQTPTLKFVQDRIKEFNQFKPEIYHTIKIEDNPYIGVVNLQNKYNKLNLNQLKINHINTTNYSVPPKNGLNTDELLSLLSKEHAVFKKISSTTTKLLGSMYLEGKISYPRTDNGSYANYKDLLIDAAKLYEKEYSTKSIIPIIEPEKKVTDHSPITPLVPLNVITDSLEKKVMSTLYNHLKKIFSGPNIYKKHTYTTIIDKGKITFSLLECVSKKFEDGVSSLKNVKVEPEFTVNCTVVQKQTCPPAMYNSTSLLKKMKKEGVGTKSTRANIIGDLIKKEYLKYKGYDLHLTPKGDYLCKYWCYNWPEITSPELTKNIESLFPIVNPDNISKYYNYYSSLLTELVSSKSNNL